MDVKVAILKPKNELIKIFDDHNLYANERENVAAILDSEMVTIEDSVDGILLVATRHLNRDTGEKIRHVIPANCIRLEDKPVELDYNSIHISH